MSTKGAFTSIAGIKKIEHIYTSQLSLDVAERIKIRTNVYQQQNE